VKEGLIKHIGVSNFGPKNLNIILENAKIRPEVNQVECHPYLQQQELNSFCKDHDIHLTAYAPLGSSDRPEGLKQENEDRLLDDKAIHEIVASRIELKKEDLQKLSSLERGFRYVTGQFWVFEDGPYTLENIWG
jgi:alcohol dehydrogenase (NADP+)